MLLHIPCHPKLEGQEEGIFSRNCGVGHLTKPWSFIEKCTYFWQDSSEEARERVCWAPSPPPTPLSFLKGPCIGWTHSVPRCQASPLPHTEHVVKDGSRGPTEWRPGKGADNTHWTKSSTNSRANYNLWRKEFLTWIDTANRKHMQKITPIYETLEFPLRSINLYKVLNTHMHIYGSNCLPVVYLK